MLTDSVLFERYMDEHYLAVPGMSSKFAALVGAAVMRLQTAAGWRGNVAEIGAFEGRFLIALALQLQPGEKAFAIDVFDWPDIHINLRLSARLEAFGLAGSVDVVCADSRYLQPDMLVAGEDARKVRFFPIDGDHQVPSLISDMELALACMEPWGVICLDDMLSPAYPELGLAVAQCLARNPDWIVFCVIDREDIAASSKFLVCRREYAEHYTSGLARECAPHAWQMQARFAAHEALVLSPAPRLVRFNPGGTVDTVQ